MAVSGSFKTNGWYSSSYGDYVYLKFSWTAKQSIDDNTSTITWSLQGSRTTSHYVMAGGFKVVIDGDTVYSKSTDYRIELRNGTVVASGTKTLTHNTHGERSFDVHIEGGLYTYAVNCSGDATFDLTTIPRATTIDSLTCATSYFDGTMTYKYTPKSANYYNRCNISLNLSGTYIGVKSINLGKKSTSQQAATVTLSANELASIYTKLPTSTKGILRFTFRTYSDSGYSKQIGSAGYKELNLTIPTSVAPSASLSLSMVNTNTWIKSLGVYVQGYSGVTASLSATPGAGASLSAQSINGGGASSNTGTLAINKLTTSGSITFTGTAKDSRGRSVSPSKTITVLPYTKPTITTLTIERGTYDGGWTADDSGADVKAVFKATIALGSNGNTYTAAFKLDNATAAPDYGTATGLASGTTGTVYFFDVDSEASHKLTLTATDKVGNSASATITIPTMHITIEYNDSGKGIAFGKTSEKDAFECAMPAEFSGGMSIVQTGGQVIRIPEIQFGTVKITPSAANTPTSAKVTFPKEFSGVPTVIVSPVGSIVGTTILGAGVTAYTTKDCLLWVTRTNTSETTLNWIAAY